MRFGDPVAAIRNLKSARLSSLGHLVSSDRNAGVLAVRYAFDDEILAGKPEGYEFRWIIKTLMHMRDSHACLSLVQDVDLMNLDPRVSANYLKEVGLKDRRVIDRVMERLASPAQEKYEGLDLHLLRCLTSRRLGEAESTELQRIASDTGRRWPIRSCAWHAYARTSQNHAELMEAAREERIPAVRRAIVTSLKGHAKRSFIRHVARNFHESRYAARWLSAA